MRRNFFFILLILIITGNLSALWEEDLDKFLAQLKAVDKQGFVSSTNITFSEKDVLLRKCLESDNYSKDYKWREQDMFFLYLMGFTSNKFDFYQKRWEMIRNNIPGFYSYKKNIISVLKKLRNIDEINSIILARLFRQAQFKKREVIYKNLRKYSVLDDRWISNASLLEGDSVFFMVKYAAKFSPFPLDPRYLETSFDTDTLKTFLPVGNVEFYNNSPPVIKDRLLAPFILGFRFAGALFKKKKWETLSIALSDPPESSEQIIHPEKYLKRERPEEILINVKPDTYSLFHNGVVGELNIRTLLTKLNPSKKNGNGWQGDKFEIYRSSNKYVFIWKTKWESHLHAQSYYTSFLRFLKINFQVRFKNIPVSDNQVCIGGSSKWGFFLVNKCGNMVYYVRSNDNKFLNKIIEGGRYD